MAKTYSGKLVIKILSREFGFSLVSQKGSHVNPHTTGLHPWLSGVGVKLRKEISDRAVTTIVPLHRELSPGTLKGVLELAEVDEKEFRKIK